MNPDAPRLASSRAYRTFMLPAAGQRLSCLPHELRHTAASLAIASGANVKVVQQMLGHVSATMTLDLYGHLFPDQLDEVADRMDAAAREAAVAYLLPKADIVGL